VASRPQSQVFRERSEPARGSFDLVIAQKGNYCFTETHYSIHYLLRFINSCVRLITFIIGKDALPSATGYAGRRWETYYSRTGHVRSVQARCFVPVVENSGKRDL
jgi:hypothetical protein